MGLDHDIWREIIDRLRLEEVVDEVDTDAREKALCALALTSRALTTPALRALWTTINSVSRKIVPVINSFAPAGEKFVLHRPLVRFQTNRWVLCAPLTEAARERAKEYLSYVRNLVTDIEADDIEFWLFLSKCLDLEVLMPKLNWLDMKVSKRLTAAPNAYAFDFVGQKSLARIISPTITRLSFSPFPSTYTSLIDVVRNSGSNLHQLFLFGPIFPEIGAAISSFRNLRIFQVETVSEVVEEPRPILISRFLESLPSLEVLQCDTNSFVIPSLMDEMSHNGLKELHISGCPYQMEVLIQAISLPSLVTLSLGTSTYLPSSRYDFNKIIASRLPGIRHLDMRKFIPEPSACLKDMIPLFSLPLESFDCCPIRDVYTPPKNFRVLLESLPSLQYFSMASDASYNAFKITAIAAQHPQLRQLDLTVALRCLLSVPLGVVAEQPPSDSRLTSILLRCTAEELPRTETEFQLLAKKLFLLFPKICYVRIGPDLKPSREAQRIVELLRSGEMASKCHPNGVD